jgi:lipid-binding SYLF domain-containing protein
LTDFVIVLNSKEAVKTFSHAGNLTLGGNMSGKDTDIDAAIHIVCSKRVLHSTWF